MVYVATSAHHQHRSRERHAATMTRQLSNMALAGKGDSSRVYAVDGVPIQEKRSSFMIRPSSPRKIAWDVISALWLLYIALALPYRMGFEAETEVDAAGEAADKAV